MGDVQHSILTAVGSGAPRTEPAVAYPIFSMAWLRVEVLGLLQAEILFRITLVEFQLYPSRVEKESSLNIRRWTVKLRRPDRARGEGTTGPRRLGLTNHSHNEN